MSDLQSYFEATARKAAAKARYDHASEALNLAGIHERLAEIKSQSEPLESLLKAPMGERERLYAAAFYVVVGRVPEDKAVHKQD